MARPRGFTLSRPAFEDIAKAHGWRMTDVAARCTDEQGEPIPLKTLSGLVHGNHRASMRTVKQVADGMGCQPPTLFPELLPTLAADLAKAS